MSSIVCIGSGNMGFALMKGAVNGGAAASGDIFFTDADFQKAQAAADSLNAKVLKTNSEAVEKGDFVFLAVKPQVLEQVLAEIAPAVQKRLACGNPPVFVSMAAGWSINKLQLAISNGQLTNESPLPAPRLLLPIIRMMPNTPALIGKGMTAFAASPEVPEEKISELEKMLKHTGIVDKIEEKYLDAVTGLSGSGPAFGYLFIEALAEGGARAGLSKDKALAYAAQTVLGAAAMIQKTGKLPQELTDMVTSPGGTTLAGLSVLRDNDFCSTVSKAVEAAFNRAKELG